MKSKDKKKSVMESVSNTISKGVNSVKNNDTLVIDFENMLVPGAILLGSLMISLSIIFSFRGTDLSTYSPTKSGTDTTNTGTNTGTNPPAAGNAAGDGTIAVVSLDDDPFLGDKKKAKVAIVEFSDYECPFCKRHNTDVFPKLFDKYVKSGDVVYAFRDLPLSFHEPAATLEALAANCVFEQKSNSGYFKMHDLIFEATNSNNDTKMNSAKMNELAKKVGGVNMSKFSKCLDDKKYLEEIQKDMADASAINITGTPGFVIGILEEDGKTIKNGTFLAGAYPYETFVTVIDGFLK